MSDANHTPDPWHIGDGLRIIGANSQRVAVCDDNHATPGLANARRIAACVNSCQGIGTEYLEKFSATTFNDFKRVKEQRDDLLAALVDLLEKGAKLHTDLSTVSGMRDMGSLLDVSDNARAAIAKAEGQS